MRSKGDCMKQKFILFSLILAFITIVSLACYRNLQRNDILIIQPGEFSQSLDDKKDSAHLPGFNPKANQPLPASGAKFD